MHIHRTTEHLDVSGSDLSGSKFDDVDLSSAWFENVKMSGWRVDTVNRAGLKVMQADMAGAAISNARTTGMTIDGILDHRRYSRVGPARRRRGRTSARTGDGLTTDAQAGVRVGRLGGGGRKPVRSVGRSPSQVVRSRS